MGFEITDGTGKGNSVGVTSNNRILTSTILFWYTYNYSY
jgi:hypothetical protein